MPISILIGEGDNKFTNQTTNYNLGKSSGFWNTVEIVDINKEAN